MPHIEIEVTPQQIIDIMLDDLEFQINLTLKIFETMGLMGMLLDDFCGSLESQTPQQKALIYKVAKTVFDNLETT